MNITFISAPAAGKGLISSMLNEKYGYPHVSIGIYLGVLMMILLKNS